MRANHAECTTCGRPLPRGTALTKRQVEVLAYLRTYHAANDCAPTFSEIAERFGFKSLSTVHEHLQWLEAKGRIRRSFNECRAIELVEAA